MRIGTENHNYTSLRKAPRLGYMDYLKSTSPLDKAQVITSTGTLGKSPFYEKVKEAEAAYQTFYKIPSEMPEIKYQKPEEVVKKDQVSIIDSYKNTYQFAEKATDLYQNYTVKPNREIEKQPIFGVKQVSKTFEIKPFKTAELTSTSYAKIPSYQPKALNNTGANLDIYI